MEKLQDTMESTQLVEVTQLEGTPFGLVRVDDQYFLGMGKYRLTPLMVKEDAEALAKEITWPMIMQIVQVMIEENLKNQKTEN